MPYQLHLFEDNDEFKKSYKETIDEINNQSHTSYHTTDITAKTEKIEIKLDLVVEYIVNEDIFKHDFNLYTKIKKLYEELSLEDFINEVMFNLHYLHLSVYSILEVFMAPEEYKEKEKIIDEIVEKLKDYIIGQYDYEL